MRNKGWIIRIIIAILFVFGVCCLNYGEYYKQIFDTATVANGISLDRGNYRVEILSCESEPDSYDVTYEVNDRQRILTSGELLQKEDTRFFDVKLPSNIRNDSIKIHLYSDGLEESDAEFAIVKRLYHMQTVIYLILYVLLLGAVLVGKRETDQYFDYAWGLGSVILLILYPIFREYPFRILLLIMAGVFVFRFLYERYPATRGNIVRYVLFLALAMIVLLFCSESSPIYTVNPWDDANIYYAIGRGVSQGFVPYRDMFDHKGPVVFFIFTLGYFLSPDKFYGIYILECISFAWVLYFAYKIYHIFTREETATILAVVSTVFLLDQSFIVYGGSCEEFVMPLYLAVLYIYLEYFGRKHEILRYKIFWSGFICGMIFWMKFNLIACPVAMMFFILLDKRIHGRKIWKDIMAFAGGGVAASIPVAGYFAYHHSLGSLIRGYFIANLAYADVKTPWETVGIFGQNILTAVVRNPVVTICIVLGLTGYLCSVKLGGNICGRIGMLLSFLGMIGSTYLSYAYDYYYCIVAVFVTLGVIVIADLVGKKKPDIDVNNKILPVAVILCILLIPLYNRNYKDAAFLTDNLSVYDVCGIEMENSGIDKTLLMYRNHWVQMMLPEGTKPAAQYFFAPNISKNFTEILEEQDRYIHEGIANFVIVDNVDLYPTLNEWGLYQYDLILDWRDDRNSVQLYRIKEKSGET